MHEIVDDGYQKSARPARRINCPSSILGNGSQRRRLPSATGGSRRRRPALAATGMDLRSSPPRGPRLRLRSSRRSSAQWLPTGKAPLILCARGAQVRRRLRRCFHRRPRRPCDQIQGPNSRLCASAAVCWLASLQLHASHRSIARSKQVCSRGSVLASPPPPCLARDYSAA